MRREPSGRAGSVRWWWSVRKPRRPTRTRSWLGPPGSQGGIGDRTHAVQGPGLGLGSALATTSREMSGKQPCRRRLLLGNAYGVMSGGGGEVAPTGVGFPRQWYPGLGGVRRATACRVGRFFSGGLLWCSRVSSGGLVVGHTAFAPVSRVSRVLWRHAGHLFLSLLFVGLPDVVGVKSMEAMRNDVPVHRRSAISREEEMAGKKRATGDPRGLLFSSSVDSARGSTRPLASLFALLVVGRRSPVAKARISFDASRDPGDRDGDGRGANGCLFFSTP